MFETRLENIIWVSTLAILFLIIGFIVFAIVYHKRYFKLVQEKILQEKAQEFNLMESIIKSQEKERKRIGEGLHDDIAPILASTLMNLDTQIQINKGKDVLHTQNAIRSIENVINKVRDTSHLLHPAALENFGFLRSLEDFCIMMNSSKGCNIEIHSILQKLSFNSFQQLTLYRTTQEIVLNALKHGNAKNLKINIYEHSEEIHLNVFHDGNKFMRKDYLKGLENPNALGLKNIQHRLKLLGGKINFKCDEDKAEQIVLLQFPLDQVIRN